MHSISIRLQQQNTGKPQELLHTRYGLMAADAFAFYRGTCGIFYEDLQAGLAGSLPDSPPAWICGDLHIANFGTYRGSTGLLYFDINDFDEAALAPALWEVLRLAASIILSCKCREMSNASAMAAARHCLDTYAVTLASGKAIYVESQMAEEEEVRKVFEEASKKTMKDVLQKETKDESGQRKFEIDGKENIKLKDKDDKQALLKHLADWIKNREELNLNKYTVEDVVFRVSGTGSVGLARYMFLLHWPHEGPNDYLIIEMKEAGPSSVLSFLGGMVVQPPWASQAHRIAQVQQRMQAVCPPILDTTRFGGKDYIVQQRQPQKKKIDFEDLDLSSTLRVTGCMARLTAYAQLRSAGREGSANADALIAFGENSSTWHEGVLNYAQAYSALSMSYYEDFKPDWDAGIF